MKRDKFHPLLRWIALVVSFSLFILPSITQAQQHTDIYNPVVDSNIKPDLTIWIRPLQSGGAYIPSILHNYIPPRMVDLGTITGEDGDSRAYDINDRSQIVGGSQVGCCEFRAFLWESGSMKDLGTLGGSNSVAHGINNSGQVVGSSEIASGYDRAFLWDQQFGMIDLGTLEGDYMSAAIDINDLGQVVGGSRSISGLRPFLWENGTMIDLGSLGGNESIALAINENSQVVGWSYLPPGSIHAFLWENGSMKDLGTLGGNESIAFGINDSGQIVGRSNLSSPGTTHAFLWENDVMFDLGTLGGESSWGLGINNSNQVVGGSWTMYGLAHPFLYENGGMIDLGSLAGQYAGSWAEASAINELGQIVGESNVTTPNFQHAFLWK